LNDARALKEGGFLVKYTDITLTTTIMIL